MPYICFGDCVIYIVALGFTFIYHDLDLLDKLRYIPNREALALRAEASKLYLCVSPNFSNVHFLLISLCLKKRDRLLLWFQI